MLHLSLRRGATATYLEVPMGQLTKQFGKIKISLPIPHLLNLQIDSYEKFLQEGVPEADRRPDEGP